MPTNQDHVLAFIALWNRRDLDGILAAMAPDCIYHNIPWAPLVGHEAIREGLSLFVADASAIDWQIVHIAQGADGSVLTERLDRFLLGEKWLEIPVMGTFELRDGLVTHWRDYFDSAQFQAAMDAIAPA